MKKTSMRKTSTLNLKRQSIRILETGLEHVAGGDKPSVDAQPNSATCCRLH
jgi:hypothetical protein